MKKKFHLLVVTFIILSSCKSNNGELIVLSNPKHLQATHVLDELWMIPPAGYNKAMSFDGFQNDRGTSSISVKIVDFSFDELKNRFSPENAKRKNWDIININPVKIKDNDKAFFVEYIDNSKSFEKYDLVIRDDKLGKTFYIASFKIEDDKSVNSEWLKSAVLTTYLDKKVEKKILYQIAVNDDVVILTKDGEYPTKSPGNEEIFAISEKFSSLKDIRQALEREILKIPMMEVESRMEIPIMNGTQIRIYGSSKGKICNFFALYIENEENIILRFSGNTKESGEEFFEYISKQIFRPIATSTKK